MANPMDTIKDLLEKVPTTVLLAAYLAFLGFDYYNFTNDPASELNVKKGELQAVQADVAKLRTRVKQANEFLKTLDLKRAELRRLAQDLQDTKASLTETLDVPGFMNQVLTEAQRVGLKIVSIKPGENSRHEYYAQQVFDLNFRGVFIQLVGFLDRLSNLQKIVRADNFAIKPISPAYGKFVELEGTLQLKTYRYIGSKADDLARGSSGEHSAPVPSGAAPAKGGS